MNQTSPNHFREGFFLRKLSPQSIFSTLLVLVYLTGNVILAHAAETNFWKSRQEAVAKAERENNPEMKLAGLPSQSILNAASDVGSELVRNTIAPILSQHLSSSIPRDVRGRLLPLMPVLSQSYGTISHVSSPVGSKSTDVIIHIQDVHKNEEAQKNISQTISSLMKDESLDLIALEGASGDIDLSAFKTCPDQTAVRETADYLLQTNAISGPVHAALAGGEKLPRIVGIDEPRHYRANIKAYQDSAAVMAATKEKVEALRRELEDKKTKLFNGDLLRFDQKASAYHDGNLEMGSYIGLLTKDQEGVSLNCQLFTEALAIEKNLNFQKVEEERARVLKILLEKLTKEEVSGLYSESLAFKMGKIEHADFYGHLRALCFSRGVDLRGFPAMNQYIQYVLLSDKISGEGLLDEMKSLEENRYSALTKNAKEAVLVRESNKFVLMKKIIDFSLTAGEWQSYKESALGNGVIPGSFEDFYREAELRDRFMAENFLKIKNESRAKTAVIVTGGFHTEGLSSQFRRRGEITITFAPRITKIEGSNGSSYLSAFTQRKTPIEKLFEGEKLFLADNPVSPEAMAEGLVGSAAAAFHKNPDEASRLMDWLKQAFNKSRFHLTNLPSILDKGAEVLVELKGRFTGQSRNSAMTGSVHFDAERHLEKITMAVSVVGIVVPLLETALASAVKAKLGIPLLAAAPLTVFNVAVVMALVLIAHAIIYRDFRRASLAQWLIVGGGIFSLVVFLPLAQGFAWSWGLHSVWNIIFLWSQFTNGPLKNILVPLYLAKFVPPVPSGEPMRRDLTELLASGRGLVFTEDADYVDAMLYRMVHTDGKQNYLRLTLKNDDDLARLLTRIHVDENGDNNPKDGRLLEILRNGGVLFIDYSNSNPKMVESFNSLFDKNPYYDNVPVISPKLTIVGAMNKDRFLHHPASFFSRFKRMLVFSTEKWKKPYETLERKPANFKGPEIELFGSDEYRQELIERFRPGKEKKVIVDEGALVKAQKPGATKNPLVIRGGDWNDPNFVYFVNQLILTGQFEFNGEPREFDPENIYVEPGDYGSREIKGEVHLLASGELDDSKNIWVVNSENYYNLFNQTKVEAPILFQDYGLIEKNAALKIRVTTDLPAWVWHKMIHTGKKLDIEVILGVKIPKDYKKLMSPKLKDQRLQKEFSSWADVKDKTSALIEGSDVPFIEEKVRSEFGEDQVVVIHPTPDTTADQLVSSIVLKTSAGTKDRLFDTQRGQLMDALRRGKVVLIEGLHANEKLYRELESALLENPYLVENGERVNLGDKGGRLFIITQPRTGVTTSAAHRVEMNPSETELKDQLRQDLRRKSGANFNESDFDQSFEKIMSLKKMFSTISAPDKKGLHPDIPNFSYSRLRLLYQFDNWLEAFENVFIGEYAEAPEKASFIRTMVRLTFDVEEEGEKRSGDKVERVTRDRQKINSVLVDKVLRQMGVDQTWDDFYWQLADSVGVDLLKEMGVKTAFSNRNSGKMFDAIKRALINRYEGNNQDRVNYFRQIFSIKDDVRNSPQMENIVPPHEESWDARIARAVELTKKGIPLMLKGSPGTGKSYFTNKLAQALHYSNGEIENITVGSDAKEEDVVARKDYDGLQTLYVNEAVGRWESKKRGFLIIDEANLPNPSLWNRLRGLVTPERAIVFTGNQDYLQGRKGQEFINDEAVTLFFPEFNDEFFMSQIDTPAFISPSKNNREALVKAVLDLHNIFKSIVGERSLSLRDVQELADRVNNFTGDDWTMREVVSIAWNQYSGLFTDDERLAIKFKISRKFGETVDGVHRGIMVDELEHDRLHNPTAGLIATHRAEYERDLPGETSLAFVEPVARMVGRIEDFLKLRDKRIARENGSDESFGKRGMIYEGPSARGKDLVVEKVLRVKGFKNGDIPAEASLGGPEKRYYKLTASMDYAHMEQVILKAQAEGSIVIVSEMNLLPSALLEGKLNDALTGISKKVKIKSGFAIVGTINSVDFSGREKFSSALQNRVIYYREDDYSDDELLEIAEFEAKKKSLQTSNEISPENLRYLVRAHAWIRSQVQNPIHRPTTRDLINVIDLALEKNFHTPNEMEANVRQIYGPLYLSMVLGNSHLPSRKELLKPSEAAPKSKIGFLAILGRSLMPNRKKPFEVISLKNDQESGGFFIVSENKMNLYEKALLDDKTWQSVFWHELGHGMFSRDFDGLTPGGKDEFDPLFQDLEDMRQLTILDTFFPFGGMSQPETIDRLFVEHLGDFVGLHAAWKALGVSRALTPRATFQLAARSIAKGLVSKEQMEAMAKQTNSLFVGANPFHLAAKHFDGIRAIVHSIPKDLRDEDDISFQQYRALVEMNKMRDDFLSLSNGRVWTWGFLSSKTQGAASSKSQAEFAQKEHAPVVPEFQDQKSVKKETGEKKFSMKGLIDRINPLRLFVYVNQVLIPIVKKNFTRILVIVSLGAVVSLISWGLIHLIGHINPASAPHISWLIEALKKIIDWLKSCLPSFTSSFNWKQMMTMFGGVFTGTVIFGAILWYLSRLFPEVTQAVEQLFLKLMNLATFGRAGAWMEKLSGSIGGGGGLDLIHGMSHGDGALAMGEGKLIVSETSADESKGVVALRPVRDSPRSETMEKLTIEVRPELEEAVKRFIGEIETLGTRFGPTGRFNEQQFFRRDPTMAWERNTADKNQEKLKIILAVDPKMDSATRRTIDESPIFSELIHYLRDNGFEIVVADVSKDVAQKNLKDPLAQVLTPSELHGMVEDIYVHSFVRPLLSTQITRIPSSRGSVSIDSPKHSDVMKKITADRVEAFRNKMGFSEEQFNLSGGRLLIMDIADLDLSDLADLWGVTEIAMANVSVKRIPRFANLKDLIIVGGTLTNEMAEWVNAHPSITALTFRNVDFQDLSRINFYAMTQLNYLEFKGQSRKAFGVLRAYDLLSHHPNKGQLQIKFEGKNTDKGLSDYSVAWWYRAYDKYVPLRWRLKFVDREKIDFPTQVMAAKEFMRRFNGGELKIDYERSEIQITIKNSFQPISIDPSLLAYLPNLTSVVFHNLIIGDLAPVLSNHKKLVNLDIFQCLKSQNKSFSGYDLGFISTLKQLESFTIPELSKTRSIDYLLMLPNLKRVFHGVPNLGTWQLILFREFFQTAKDQRLPSYQNVVFQDNFNGATFFSHIEFEGGLTQEVESNPYVVPFAQMFDLTLEEQISMVSMQLLQWGYNPDHYIKRTGDTFSLKIPNDIRSESGYPFLADCTKLENLTIDLSVGESLDEVFGQENLTQVTILTGEDNRQQVYELFQHHPQPKKLAVDYYQYVKGAYVHTKMDWDGMPGWVKYNVPRKINRQFSPITWAPIVSPEKLELFKILRFLVSPIDTKRKVYDRLFVEGNGLAIQFDNLLISFNRELNNYRTREIRDWQALLAGVGYSLIVVAMFNFFPALLSQSTNPVMQWIFLLPGVYLTALVFLIWMAKALGYRAGPNFVRELEKLKKSRPENFIPFLQKSVIDTSKRTSFFEVDSDHVLHVNPYVFNFLSMLPTALQNILLHGFGVIGHEISHQEGHGEIYAYARVQVLPALAGSLVGGVGAMLIGISSGWIGFFAVIGAFSAVALESTRREKEFNEVQNLGEIFGKYAEAELTSQSADAEAIERNLEEAGDDMGLDSLRRDGISTRPLRSVPMDVFANAVRTNAPSVNLSKTPFDSLVNIFWRATLFLSNPVQWARALGHRNVIYTVQRGDAVDQMRVMDLYRALLPGQRLVVAVAKEEQKGMFEILNQKNPQKLFQVAVKANLVQDSRLNVEVLNELVGELGVARNEKSNWMIARPKGMGFVSDGNLAAHLLMLGIPVIEMIDQLLGIVVTPDTVDSILKKAEAAAHFA